MKFIRLKPGAAVRLPAGAVVISTGRRGIGDAVEIAIDEDSIERIDPTPEQAQAVREYLARMESKRKR